MPQSPTNAAQTEQPNRRGSLGRQLLVATRLGIVLALAVL